MTCVKSSCERPRSGAIASVSSDGFGKMVLRTDSQPAFRVELLALVPYESETGRGCCGWATLMTEAIQTLFFHMM